MQTPWYEKSSDPLDNAVDIGEGNTFADFFPSPELDPLQILILCEDQSISIDDYIKEPPCHS